MTFLGEFEELFKKKQVTESPTQTSSQMCQMF